MENVLIVIHLILAIALILVVLLQKTAQDGGGLVGGSGTMGGLFTTRGSANLLTRTTAILATAFIATSLLLGIVAARQHKSRSIESRIEQTAPTAEKNDKETKETPTPAEPEVPVSK